MPIGLAAKRQYSIAQGFSPAYVRPKIRPERATEGFGLTPAATLGC